jgi:hypothetical protein
VTEAEIVARRRKWTAEQKQALLSEVEAAGGRVAMVVRRPCRDPSARAEHAAIDRHIDGPAGPCGGHRRLDPERCHSWAYWAQRPRVPILATTTSVEVSRRLRLQWGADTVLCEEVQSYEEIVGAQRSLRSGRSSRAPAIHGWSLPVYR